MNDGSFIMIPNKNGNFTRIPRELKTTVCFEKKENLGIDHFLDLGIGNYAILDKIPHITMNDQVIEGLWQEYFDGSFFENGYVITIVIEIPNSKICHHAFKLQVQTMRMSMRL